jgi:hypothetical protein
VRLPAVTSPFGNAGRNIGRSPSFYQFDFGLQKSFALPFSEASRIEFRAEFFNILNKTNFGAPNGNASGLVFDANGRVTATGGFGQIRSAFPARQIQFALKVSF